jgi:hypothetical protein
VARQAVLGPAGRPPVADLATTRKVGERAVGALGWVAEQLDVVTLIDRVCGGLGAQGAPRSESWSWRWPSSGPVRLGRSAIWPRS